MWTMPSVPRTSGASSGRYLDLLAVAATGAYCYSMANSYNRLPRPAVVAVRDGTARVLLRRETPEDHCSEARLSEAFNAENLDVRKLALALTQTDAFLYRRFDAAVATTPGVMP